MVYFAIQPQLFLSFLVTVCTKIRSHFDNMEFSNVFENIILNSKISRFKFVKAETFEVRAFPTHLIGIS